MLELEYKKSWGNSQVERDEADSSKVLVVPISSHYCEGMKKILFLVIIPLFFLLSGCASFYQMFGEKPKAELKEVFLKDASLTGATMVLVVNVMNPNRFDIEVDEIEYKVFLFGKEFSTAKTEKSFVVPAKNSTNIEIPLPVKFGSLWEHLSQALFSKVLDYRIEGQAKLSFTTIPFSKEGKMELK